ncbi:hypothetical protein J7E71_26820 [Mesobacillus foraminis]|uniref:hypothetical protein n=1 Tax=Mesobacillus foraminis TaxID=279826 RepID=UPI001BEBBD8F|nr:hypothetical protein [Mesobacillus foraminis]MBT2759486.1 hypothetical protein [Mesobacillus foraminis]
MDKYLFLAFSLFYIGLFLWGLQRGQKVPLIMKASLLLVTAGLIYDNGILAVSDQFGKSEGLKKLHFLRYWIHALFTPTLVLFSWTVIKNTDTELSKKRGAGLAAFSLTALLIIWELVHTAQLSLKPVNQYGVLNYESAASQGPPIMIMAVSAALLFAGIVVWKKQSWKWMAIGVALMAAGSAIPLPIKSNAATNCFELILISSLWATLVFQEKKLKGA